MKPVEHDVYVCCRDVEDGGMAAEVAAGLARLGFRVFVAGQDAGAASGPGRLKVIEEAPDFVLLSSPSAVRFGWWPASIPAPRISPTPSRPDATSSCWRTRRTRIRLPRRSLPGVPSWRRGSGSPMTGDARASRSPLSGTDCSARRRLMIAASCGWRSGRSSPSRSSSRHAVALRAVPAAVQLLEPAEGAAAAAPLHAVLGGRRRSACRTASGPAFPLADGSARGRRRPGSDSRSAPGATATRTWCSGTRRAGFRCSTRT